MCFGAAAGSGGWCPGPVTRTRDVGFDEGARLVEWKVSEGDRGITVKRDVPRREAAAVLRAYAERGGHIYNARAGD